MIKIKTQEEIKIMREAGKINYQVHELIQKNIKVGVTTLELNDLAYDYIINANATPSFLDYNGFPKSVCISINDEVVHGIPRNRKLENGDIISVDVGVFYKGYHSDAARTHILGDVTPEVRSLVENTEKSFYEGISGVKDGALLKDIGIRIKNFARKNNLSVIRELVGHGVGEDLHEEPEVPNFKVNSNIVLKEGMVIAVEPMLNLGERFVYLEEDDWTIKTEDGMCSAHYEHTVLVTKDGYQILTGE